MKRWIYACSDVRGDAKTIETTLLVRAPDLFRTATSSPGNGPDGDGSILVELDSDVAHLDLAKQIRVHFGVAHRDRDRVVLPLTWRADPASRLFPRFDGALEWEGLSSAIGQLTLAGSYEVPLGVLGSVVDAVAIPGVARRTAQRLVDSVAAALQKAVLQPSSVAAPVTGHGVMRVRDVMSPRPIVLDESLPLRTAALIFFSADISGAPVVTPDGSLVGVLSEADLLAKEADDRFGFGRDYVEEDRRREAVTVGEACSRPARVTSPDSRLAAAAAEMLEHDVSRLVAIGGGRILGIVTRHDVLAALVRDDRSVLEEVHSTLHRLGLQDIDAVVEWGRVVLSGSTKLRSQAGAARQAVAGIDGVVSVAADQLTWEADDVLPHIPLASA